MELHRQNSSDILDNTNCKFSGHGYECVLCGIWLSAKYLLKIHIINHFQLYDNCKICALRDHRMCLRENIKQKPASDDPEKIMDADKEFFCGHCRRGFFEKRQLKLHVKLHLEFRRNCSSNANGELVNRIRGESNGSIAALSNSEIIDSYDVINKVNHVFAEGVRQKANRKRVSLKDNENIPKSTVNTDQSDEIIYLCDICKKRFDDYYSVKSHIMRHLAARSLKCNICLKAFSKQQSLEKHIQRKHWGISQNDEFFQQQTKKFDCFSCGKSFGQLSNLRTHLLIHTGVKPFVCQVCKRAFGLKASYLAHLATHEDVKPFLCKVCQKGFPTKKSLKRHSGIHADEKSFMCDTCGRSFGYSFSLMRHIRTHTGEKPFVCSTCSKAFTSGHALNLHTRSHTGEKPFQCQLCHLPFARKKYMRQHFQRSHSAGVT